MKITYADLNLDMSFKNPITGDITRNFDIAAINTAIKNILFTRKGTIPFNREIGTNLWKLIGELNTPFIQAIVIEEVTHALIKFEPRISNINVTAIQSINNENEIIINISYTIKSSSSLGSLELNLSLNR